MCKVITTLVLTAIRALLLGLTEQLVQYATMEELLLLVLEVLPLLVMYPLVS